MAQIGPNCSLCQFVCYNLDVECCWYLSNDDIASNALSQFTRRLPLLGSFYMLAIEYFKVGQILNHSYNVDANEKYVKLTYK